MPVLVVTVGDPGIVEKEDADSVFMEMICPSGTNPDDSPLYVLCCNDTCSFTWTGAEHINQVSPLGAGGGGSGGVRHTGRTADGLFLTLLC